MTDLRVSRMSAQQRLTEAMRRSLPLLPANARAMVQSLLRPESVAIVTGTLVVWAGSHFFGIGQIVDVILIGIGVIALGFSVFEGAAEFYTFATIANGARSEAHLDKAAVHFARSVTLLGVSTIQALLLRGQSQSAVARGRPSVLPRISPGAPPPAGNQLRLSRPSRLPGSLGGTDAYGAIVIARNQSLTEQRITLFHELVHRYFSPRVGPFRRLRAELRMSAYMRSTFLRYLEELLAEGYGQLRVHGLAKALAAYRFPLDGGYVTISSLSTEGLAIGTIVLGGTLFNVSISLGSIPK